MQKPTRIHLVAGLAALAALLMYARTLGYNYLWDDIAIFRGTVSSLLETSDISIAAQPFMGEVPYFRPLVVLSFWLDAVLAGNRPGFSHAENLVIFLVNILLVFSICRRLAETLGSPRPPLRAFLAALVYAIHPVMVESTTWISGRFDVLATLFILGATRVYISNYPARWRIAGLALLSLLAMLSKETGVMLLPGVFCLCLAMESARHNTPLSLAHFRQSLTQNGKALIAILAVTVVYIALRLGFASVSYLDYRETAAGGIWNNLFLALESLKFYFHQALFPFATMTPRHPIVYVVSAWSPADILGNLATLAALAILVFYALRRQSAAAWVFLAGICYLALALHIVPIPIAGNLGHERFLSAPLAFWSMAAVLVRWEQIFAMPFMQKFAAGMNVLSPRLIAQMAAGAWLAMFAWTTHTTIPLWQDDLALWSWARQQFPDDKFSRYNYFRTMTLIDLETAKRAADFLKQETGFLYADEAILYASILLDNGDEKSFDYLKQVQQTAGDSLDMHRQPDAESLREKLSPMEASVISKYYALSAMAYFRFHKNPATALQLNEAALWYKQRTERDIGAKGAFGINVYKTAYLYGMGFFDTANKLRDELAASNGIEKEKINKLIQPILDNYCQFPESTEEKKAENPLLLVCDGIKVSMNQ